MIGCTLITVCNSFSSIKFGMSLTKTDISDPLSTPGILIGAESSEPETHFKLKFCTGFYFTLHSGYLKDKLTWSHPGNLSLYDISYKIGFLEVPMLRLTLFEQHFIT